jgi:hypothetical protein
MALKAGMKIFWLATLLAGSLGVVHAAGPAGEEPSSRLVRRIEDKLGRKLAPLPRDKILAAEKELAEKTRAAHAAYCKQVADVTGFTVKGIEEAVSADDLMKTNGDDLLVKELERQLRRPLQTADRRAVARAVRERKLAIQPWQDKLAQAVVMYGGLRRDQAEDVLRGD